MGLSSRTDKVLYNLWGSNSHNINNATLSMEEQRIIGERHAHNDSRNNSDSSYVTGDRATQEEVRLVDKEGLLVDGVAQRTRRLVQGLVRESSGCLSP